MIKNETILLQINHIVLRFDNEYVPDCVGTLGLVRLTKPTYYDLVLKMDLNDVIPLIL